jgi:hypothetical protein
MDAYLAFNFFITAEHLLDWQFPGQANEPQRRVARQTDVLLEITSHIASGAKHFIVEAKHHKSVVATQRRSGYFGRYMGHWFGHSMGARGLFVVLDGSAATHLGQSISAVELARRVMAYWNAANL